MRLGVGRLLLAIASVVARQAGDAALADLFAYAFLGVLTLHLYRAGDLRSAVRAARS